ncbi:MAG TPA: AI-2E family transporter [Candidatus Saccharimonadales bacterium]
MPSQSKDHQKTELVITTQTFVKTVLLIVGTVLILNLLRASAHALLILFSAFFLALALNAPVSFLARHFPGRVRGSRAWATSIAFLIVVALLGAFIASLVPPIVKQTQNLVNAAPGLIEDVREQEGTVGELIRRYNLENEVENFSSQLSDRLKNGAGTAFNTVQDIGSSAITLLTVLVLTFMMLVEGPRRLKMVHELVPSRHKTVARRAAKDMYRVIKGYVNGQVLLASMAAILITPVFFILDISYPIGLMVIVFICGLIPMVGHTIGAVIVTLVALFTSPVAALIVLLYYILYQQIENYLIQPRVQANTTDMSPLLVFGSVVVGVSIGGIFGGLVAIPVAGCIRVLILEYLRSKNLVDAPTVKDEINSAIGTTK